MGPSWDPCFDRAKIIAFRPLIKRTYAEIEEVTDTKIDSWPPRIECMSSSEIGEGQMTGAGHGLFQPPCEIKINASMTAYAIFGNFVHEHIHYARPDLQESTVDDMTEIVMNRLAWPDTPRTRRLANKLSNP